MKSKLLYESGGLRTFALIFDKGDAVREKLLEFAAANRFSNVQLTAIGAFNEVTLGYFDRERKDYKKIPVQEQVEVLSFAGNIVQKEGKPMLHAHVVVGKSDGTALGGHFLGGKVWPTLEMVVAELPVQLTRTLDEETGLALINLAA
ncbi:MAG TPA: PPC domain-containing DNA-binding protein [Candidatus Angelobacter sp.]|nr:PPC domain-containing DNA-binding protein [Candidatus Angelobacter sp.]